MAQEELIDRRTKNSKTYRTESGLYILDYGRDMHFEQDGQFIDKVKSWRNLADRFESGQYPYTVTLNKADRSVTMSFGAESVTLRPTNTRVPSVSVVDDAVVLAGLWRGITLKLVLGEVPDLVFVRTSTTYVNPTIEVTGFVGMLAQMSYANEGFDVPVPATLSAGLLTIPMGDVPLNAEVS